LDVLVGPVALLQPVHAKVDAQAEELADEHAQGLHIFRGIFMRSKNWGSDGIRGKVIFNRPYH
jgi:hypothetical protein